MNKNTTTIFIYFAIGAFVIFVLYNLFKKREGFQQVNDPSDDICRNECPNTLCGRFEGGRENDRQCYRIYYTNTRSCNVGDYRGDVYDSRNSTISKDRNLPICIGTKYTRDVPDNQKHFLKRDMNARPEDCDVSRGELPYKHVDISGRDLPARKYCMRLQPVLKGKECMVTETARANGYVAAFKINSFSDVKDSRRDRDICLVVRNYPR
jgi:hypothetical protein